MAIFYTALISSFLSPSRSPHQLLMVCIIQDPLPTIYTSPTSPTNQTTTSRITAPCGRPVTLIVFPYDNFCHHKMALSTNNNTLRLHDAHPQSEHPSFSHDGRNWQQAETVNFFLLLPDHDLGGQDSTGQRIHSMSVPTDDLS